MNFWSDSVLKTAADVADWVEFALQLPEYRENFESNHVTGMELPDLVANGGALLRQQIGIENVIGIELGMT